MEKLILSLEERLANKRDEYEFRMGQFKRDVEMYTNDSLFEKNEMGVLSNMTMLKGEIHGLEEALELVKAYANCSE